MLEWGIEEEGAGERAFYNFLSEHLQLFFKLSMCVLEEGEGQGSQIVVLNEIPISLKAGSLDSR